MFQHAGALLSLGRKGDMDNALADVKVNAEALAREIGSLSPSGKRLPAVMHMQMGNRK